MQLSELESFMLVGGTALSLRLGHRLSIDIDLFTDSESLDFTEIYLRIKEEFNYVSDENWSNQAIGNTCFIGNNHLELVKLDLFYTDKFVFPSEKNIM